MLFNLISVLNAFFMADASAVPVCLPLSVSAWHCHPPQPHVNTSPLLRGGFATAKDKEGWPVIWLSYPTPCTHPVKGHWRHDAQADAVHLPCQCHLTFCLAVSVGRCCSCCYKPGNFHCGKVKAVKWVASHPKMPHSLLRIMMCI